MSMSILGISLLYSSSNSVLDSFLLASVFAMFSNSGPKPNSSNSTSLTPCLFFIVPSHCFAGKLVSGISSIASTVERNIAGLSSGACDIATSVAFPGVPFCLSISPTRATAFGTFFICPNSFAAPAIPPIANFCLSILSCGSNNGNPSDIGPFFGGTVSVKSLSIKPPSLNNTPL